MTGFEPATARTTIWCSTTELHPPCLQTEKMAQNCPLCQALAGNLWTRSHVAVLYVRVLAMEHIEPKHSAELADSLENGLDNSPATPLQSAAWTPMTTLTAIMISVFFMGMGTALQGSAVSLRAGIAGFPDAIIGFILSANYAGLVVGSLLGPGIIRKVGYVRSFAAFASMASISSIAHVLWINPYAWIVFRLTTGLCLAVMLVVVESWLNASSTSYNRGRVLSIYSMMYLGSMGVGQPLLAVFSPASFELFGVTTVLISFCLVPVALMQVTGDAVSEYRPPRLIKTLMNAPLAGVGTMVAGVITGATWSLGPRYGQLLGLGDGRVGFLMMLVALGTLVMQWPLGWVSDRKDRRRAIFLSVAVAFGAALVMALSRASGSTLFVLMFLFGGFGMPLYSLCIALINDQLAPEHMIQAAGAVLLYYGIGSALGPLLAGMSMAVVGPAGLFLFMAAVLALYLLFVIARLRLAPNLRVLRSTAYRAYPRTTPAAFELMRRARPRRPTRRKDTQPQEDQEG